MAAMAFPLQSLNLAPALQPLTRMLRAPVRHDYLLLLSHMRSYSSLLAHLLGGAPEVEGYGETQLRYRTPLDLWRLRHSIRRATGQRLRGRWLLDKMLHNGIRPVDRWVDPDRVRAIIFLRKPGPTLRSLLALADAHSGNEPLSDPQKCCDYYVSRLHRLRQDGERLGPRALYFDAEMLPTQPQAVLAAVGAWLGLAETPALNYQPGRRTGIDGFGDPSPNIHAGRVLAPAPAASAPRVLDPAIEAEAYAAYRRCRAALQRHNHTIAA